MRQVAVLALFLAAALSGCANGDYLAVEGYQDPEPVQDGNATANETLEVNETVGKVPVVGDLVLGVDNITFAAGTPFNVSLAFYPNGTAPVNATTNVTDAPAYEDVFWSVNITQGNITVFQNGTSLPALFAVNVTEATNVTLGGYALLGGQLFNATAHNLTTVGAFGDLGPQPFCGDDPADRGSTPADIVGICVLVDEASGSVVYGIALGAATGIDGCQEYPLTWGVYPGGADSPIEVYCSLGLGVGNWAGGQNFGTAATAELDGNTIVLTVPLAELEALDVFSVYGEVWNGPGAYGGRPMWIPGSIIGESLALDRAPDAGAFTP